MSISDEKLKIEDITKLVRKSASTNHNSDSIEESEEYLEHRTKFLECRKQFEQPPPPLDKKPFFPHWIKPEFNTNVSITYKKRGPEITDVRINYLDGSYVNNNEENLLDEKTKQLGERPNRFMRWIERSQSSGSDRDRQDSTIVFKTADKAEGNCIEKEFRRNGDQNLINSFSIPCKTIVCRPIVRNVIELKKYDHIVEDVISNHRRKK